MTIKEFAKEKGVSLQAVYQKIKSSGLDLKSIKDSETGELTADGLKELDKLFIKNNDIQFNGLTALKVELAALKQENDHLRDQVDDLKGQRDGWKEQAQALQETINGLQTALQQAQQTAQQAQALNMASIKLLPPPRQGIFSRLKQRMERKKTE